MIILGEDIKGREIDRAKPECKGMLCEFKK